MTTGVGLTIDDFLDSPHVHEKPYRELVYGRPVAKASPTGVHQTIDMVLFELFRFDAATAQGAGRPELHVRFDDADDARLLVPDFAWYAQRERFHPGVQHEPPTVVAEVRSPGQPLAGLREKARFYRRHGVEAVWLIDPRTHRIEVWDSSGDGVVRQGSDVLAFRALTLAVEERIDRMESL